MPERFSVPWTAADWREWIFSFDKKTGRVLFNELNTMPGFTPISMYPMLWVQAGMTETELWDRFIELALKRDSGIRG